jgi:PAS domain S-box-containing protein
MERFFDLTPDLLCIADFNGYFRRVNASFTRVLGYSAEELLSRPFISFVHPDDVTSTLAETRKLIDGEPCAFFTNRYVTKDGRWRWLQWNATPCTTEHLIYAAARDITDQLLAEEGRTTLQSRERALLDHSAAAIYIKDREGRYEFVNLGFERLYRTTAQEVVGSTAAELAMRGLRQGRVLGDEDVWTSGETVQTEEILHDGHISRTLLSVRFPLHDSHRQMCSLAGIATDITERLRASIIDHELDLARTIQQRLYPSTDPVVPGLQIAGRCVPVDRMCGDCLDYVKNSRGETVLVIGDVSGHGLGPALEMVQVRSLLRVLLRQHELGECLTQLRDLTLDELNEQGFVTLFMGCFSGDNRFFHYVGAGHDARILHPDNCVEYLDSTTTPLGIGDALSDAAAIAIRPGDILLVMTDGVAEAGASRNDCFGVERAMELVKGFRDAPAKQMLEHLLHAVQLHAGPDLTDDVTAIVVKVLE